jgi:hypothetical protein
MSNIITTIEQSNQKSIFDYLTLINPADAVDALPKFKNFAKELTETIKEVEQYLVSSNQSIEGDEYILSSSLVDDIKSEYNPNLIFVFLRDLSPEIQKEFLNNVKITKKDFTAFCKKHGLKEKNFENCLKIEDNGTKEKIQLKLKK